MQKGILGLLGAVVVIVLSVFFNHTQHQTTTNSSANQQSAQQNTNEDTVSNTADGKQIPVTLVSAVDGDTIKIMYNGKKKQFDIY
nr:hypothetical protein [Heyndrickxia ginsengihumi]